MGAECTIPRPNIIYSNKLNENMPSNQIGSYTNYGITKKLSFNDFDEIEKLSERENFVHHLLDSFIEFKEQNCLGYRKFNKEKNTYDSKFTYFNYAKIGEISNNLAYGLIRNMLIKEEEFSDEEKAYQFLGILSENCIEWACTDFASQLDSITTIPFDINNITEKKFFEIVKVTKLITLAVSKKNGFNLLNNFMKNSKSYGECSLKNVIVYDLTEDNKENSELVSIMKEYGITLYYFTDLIKFDENNNHHKLKQSDNSAIFTILFSSEDEGDKVPKGVKLSQQNLSSQLTFVADSGININLNDCYYSYVSLSNIIERVLILQLITYGSSIGFASWSKFNENDFFNDIKTLSPTILLGKPQTLLVLRNYFIHLVKIHNNDCSKGMIKNAILQKRESFMKNLVIEDSFYDSWALGGIKHFFGGKIRFLISFFDHLPSELAIDLKILFASPVIEVYGNSELGGVCLTTHMDDLHNNCTGGPLTTAKVKLVGRSDIGFTINNNPMQGELYVKGPILFQGYFQNKTLSDKIISDGWYSTGDIMMLKDDNLGFIMIDSVNNLIKLDERLYVSPNNLESKYIRNKYISQICIISSNNKDKQPNSLIAVIVPSRKKLLDFLIVNKKISVQQVDDLGVVEKYFNSEEVISEVLKECEEIYNLDKKGLSHHEKIEKIYLISERFSEENGMKNGKGRLNRKNVEKYYLEHNKKV